MTTVKEAAAILGRKGGQAKTPKKIAAAKLNGRKGGKRKSNSPYLPV